MTAGSATWIRGPVTGCHVDQSENATCLQGPVKTCHVDQLDHGARGGVLRNVKNEQKVPRSLKCKFDVSDNEPI